MKNEINMEEELKKIEWMKNSMPNSYEIYLSQIGMNIQGNFYVFEYIAKFSKQPTLWISFNTVYNEIHTLKKEFSSVGWKNYLNPKNTVIKARKEFLDFMQTNFPDTKIVMVFDLAQCMQYPYSNDKRVNEALWIMDYKEAVKLHEENTKAWEKM